MTRPDKITFGSNVFHDDQNCTVEGISFPPKDAAPILRLRGDNGTIYATPLNMVAASYEYASADGPDEPANPRMVIEGLPEPLIAQAEERLKHMQDIATPDRTASLADRVTRKAEELGIAERTVYRWWSDYGKQGIWGLVDQRKIPHSSGPARIDERVREAMYTAAENETDDSTGTRQRLYRRTQQILDERHGENVVAMPTQSTFNRYCDDLFARRNPYVFADATTRRTNAASPDGPFTPLTVQRPGERVEFDTTRLDILAWDPIENITQSLELTAALDVHTRSILACRLTPVATNSIDVSLLLADILQPVQMLDHWEDSLRLSALMIPVERLIDIDERIANAAARPIILPETVVIDHGKAYMSNAFRDACQQLGISITPARVGRATDKAKVERWFGTLRTMFAEHVAGYKSQSVAHRGRDVEGRAFWTVAELEELLDEFIVSVYQRRRHQGLVLSGHPDVMLSPNEAYAEAVTRTGIVMMPHNPGIYFDLLPTEWRVIRHPGTVEVKGLRYADDILYRYRNSESDYDAQNGKWPIKYDPRNRNFVYFQDPETGEWQPIRWIHAYDDSLPFTDRTRAFAISHLKSRGISRPTEIEISEGLWDLQNRTDLPANEVAKKKLRLTRDAERQRHATRDQERGGMHLHEVQHRPEPAPAEPDDDRSEPIRLAPVEAPDESWDL